MQDKFITQGSICGILDAAANLADVSGRIAGEQFTVYRHGRRFERSGDSMAIYDGEYRLDRILLSTPTEQAFLEAIDAWEMARYIEVA